MTEGAVEAALEVVVTVEAATEKAATEKAAGIGGTKWWGQQKWRKLLP